MPGDFSSPSDGSGEGSELHTDKLLCDRVCTVSLCAVGLFRLREGCLPWPLSLFPGRLVRMLSGFPVGIGNICCDKHIFRLGQDVHQRLACT